MFFFYFFRIEFKPWIKIWNKIFCWILKGGQDWQSVIQQKVELQEKENELQKNQSLLEQANNAINDLKKQLQEEIRLKDHALAGKFTVMKLIIIKISY